MRRDLGLLEDMLQATRDVREFCRDLDFPEFSTRKAVRYAILHSLTILGEAANRISQEYQRAHGEIPWRRIVAFRYRLIHGYGELDLELVWEVATKLSPRLEEQLRELVDSYSEETP
jgi:uncharacterized protein with HEPN domain